MAHLPTQRHYRTERDNINQKLNIKLLHSSTAYKQLNHTSPISLTSCRKRTVAFGIISKLGKKIYKQP